MTAKPMRRRRANSPPIPEPIQVWFGCGGPVPWEGLLPGDVERVPGWWLMWLETHPGATPPTNASWITWPDSSTAQESAHNTKECSK